MTLTPERLAALVADLDAGEFSLEQERAIRELLGALQAAQAQVSYLKDLLARSEAAPCGHCSHPDWNHDN